MKSVGSQPIATARLYLRKPEMTDAQPLVEIRSLAMSLTEARKAVEGMIEEGKHPFAFHWVITAEGRVIGRIKAWDVSPYNGYLQLGYDLAPVCRGMGYMTEAVNAVIDYLMNVAEVNRVFCSVREGNLASRRVCEKCGMRYEGKLRQHYQRQDGGYDDVCIYGIVKSDLHEAAAVDHP